MSASPAEPELSGTVELSVVIALTSAHAASLRRCLKSLAASCAGISVEILVPYDERLASAAQLSIEHPFAVFQDCRGAIADETPPTSHLRLDILRAAGLKRSRGRIVALIEDYSIVSRQWAREIVAAHNSDAGAVAGSIENAADGALSEALYLCNFRAYSPDRAARRCETASDANVSYEREVLEEFRSLWSAAYDEQTLHEAFRRSGKTIAFEPAALLRHNRPARPPSRTLGERVEWGRWYARARQPRMSSTSRIAFLVFAWLLPAVLTLRAIPDAISPTRRQLCVFTIPAVFVLYSAWVLGECLECLSAR